MTASRRSSLRDHADRRDRRSRRDRRAVPRGLDGAGSRDRGALHRRAELKITFTGGRKYSHPRETTAFNARRYKWVKKKMERTDVVPGHGETIVYNLGTLYGEWPDGTPFEGNRYVDRFVVRGGKIVQMDVWNDSAERLLTRTASRPDCALSALARFALAVLRAAVRAPSRIASSSISLRSRRFCGSRLRSARGPRPPRDARPSPRRRARHRLPASASMMARCSLTAHSDECGRL